MPLDSPPPQPHAPRPVEPAAGPVAQPPVPKPRRELLVHRYGQVSPAPTATTAATTTTPATDGRATPLHNRQGRRRLAPSAAHQPPVPGEAELGKPLAQVVDFVFRGGVAAGVVCRLSEEVTRAPRDGHVEGRPVQGVVQDRGGGELGAAAVGEGDVGSGDADGAVAEGGHGQGVERAGEADEGIVVVWREARDGW